MASKDVTEVAVCENWKSRVRAEHDTARSWHSNWGFLAGQDLQGSQSLTLDTLDNFLSGCPDLKLDYLATFQRQQEGEVDDNNKTTAEARPKLAHTDSLDGLLAVYMKRLAPAGVTLRPYPRDEFRLPMLSSHAYGWGSNMERFGRLSAQLR